MFVLGTSGHVDHGKSSFLRALTGQEPDRLPEEKKRGMTIDLNFVWIPSAKHGRVGIVDVPGHQRFVKNMISGAMNVDAFLFVLAADDGWMPQSEEHLGVLKSLGITSGIGIITKTDLVDDARAAEAEAQLRQKLFDAFGKEYDILRFSAVSPVTLPEIREKIEKLLGKLPLPRDIGASRFWIDRVFLPKGLGVVVTGTLREGTLKEGDEVTILPLNRVAQVKSLQSYGESVHEASPVSRVAAQLSKVSAEELQRGMLVQKTRKIALTTRADAKVDFFEKLEGRNVEMAFHVGTGRALALVIPLGTGFARIKLPEPLPLRAGDRFVLRTVGEERTIGAGVIADPQPFGLSHKRAREALTLWGESVKEFLAYEARKTPLLDAAALVEQSSYSRAEIEHELKAGGRHRELSPGVFTEAELWEKAKDAAKKALTGAAAKGPLGEGDFLRQLGSVLGLPQKPLKAFLLALTAANEIKKEAKGYSPAGAARVLDAAESARRGKLHAVVKAGAAQPVSLREAIGTSKELKNSAYQLAKEGELVSLGDDHFISRADYDALKDKAVGFIKEKGQGATSDLRVFLNLSRKNVVLVLEQMDRERITYLKDNVRRLMKG